MFLMKRNGSHLFAASCIGLLFFCLSAGAKPQNDREVTAAMRGLLRSLDGAAAENNPAALVLGLRDEQENLKGYVLKMNGAGVDIIGPLNFLPLAYGDSLQYVYEYTEVEITREAGGEVRLKAGVDTLWLYNSLKSVFLTNDAATARKRGNMPTENPQHLEMLKKQLQRGENKAVWYNDCSTRLEYCGANVLTVTALYSGDTGGNQIFRELEEYSLSIGQSMNSTISGCEEYLNPEALGAAAAAPLRLEDFVGATEIEQVRARIVADLEYRRKNGVASGDLAEFDRIAVAFDASLLPTVERQQTLNCMDPCVDDINIASCRVVRWLGRMYAITQSHCRGNYLCTGGIPYRIETLVGAVGDESDARSMPFDPADLLAAGVVDAALSSDGSLALFVHEKGLAVYDVAAQRLLWQLPFDLQKSRIVMVKSIVGDNMKRLLDVLADD